LLVNELSDIEEILNRLAGAERPNSGSPQVWIDDKVPKFKASCTKARQAWALAVFSGAGRPSLERYFTYHLQLLTDLSGKLQFLANYPVAACTCSPQDTLNSIFESELDALAGHLLHFFSDYPDRSITAPASYIGKFIRNLEQSIAALMLSPVLSSLPGPLAECAAPPRSAGSTPVSWHVAIPRRIHT